MRNDSLEAGCERTLTSNDSSHMIRRISRYMQKVRKLPRMPSVVMGSEDQVSNVPSFRNVKSLVGKVR